MTLKRIAVTLGYLDARKFSATFPNPRTPRPEHDSTPMSRNPTPAGLSTVTSPFLIWLHRLPNLGHVSTSGLAMAYKITAYFHHTCLEALDQNKM